jgi:hypothetical protein
MSSPSLKETVFDYEWMKIHEQKLKEFFPETWTNVSNINGLKIGFGLKLLGVDWRTEEEFGAILLLFEDLGLLLREGYTIRRSNHVVFK